MEATRKLAARGIVLRYFFTQRNTFDKQLAEWSERYTVSEVSRTDATVWFVVVAKPGEEVTLDAQEMKTPTMDIREAERRIAEAEGNSGPSTLNFRVRPLRRPCSHSTPAR